MALSDLDYLQIDFDTLVDKLKTEIQNDGVFYDVNYEGSNIRTLIELLAYIGELNTYWINKIAKNMYEETSDIYETSHMLAKQKGYDPKGPRSSQGTATITINNRNSELHIGDQLYVPAWRELASTEKYDGVTIIFSTTTSITHTVASSGFSSSPTSGSYSFNIPIRQGIVIEYNTLTGDDIVDYEILLPSRKFAYDDNIDDEYPSIQLSVNDENWERVSNFYDDMSGLSGNNQNIFKFEYDKYKRNKIVFSSSANIPQDTDEINITVLESLGANGNIGANRISSIDDDSVYNITTGVYIDNQNISVTNPSATDGGADAETLADIRLNSRLSLHSQFRNVSKLDYIAALTARSDINGANAWGEMEIAPSAGDTREYHKVYLSIIPDTWSSSTINYGDSILTRTVNSTPLTASIITPTSYSEIFKSNISTAIETKKMLNQYELFVVPTLVYFYIDFELKVKRLYEFTQVKNAILDKLEYYFQSSNRSFGETIDFMKIQEYILDSSEISPNDNFTDINGILSLEVRDIDTNVTIYEPNTSFSPRYYPQYTTNSTYWQGDNKLRRIKLDNNQFPMLLKNLCVVYVAP